MLEHAPLVEQQISLINPAVHPALVAPHTSPARIVLQLVWRRQVDETGVHTSLMHVGVLHVHD